MATKFISHADNSRTNWGSTLDENSAWPGEDKIQIGCLQRIAKAVESMARNHDDLVNSRDYWLNYAKRLEGERSKLKRSNAALRGYLKRVRKS